MVKIKQLSLLLTILFFTATCFGQTITGSWYGVGLIKDSMYAHEAGGYLTELILTQKGKTVKGQFNYYFRDGFFSNKIVGSFVNESERLRFNKINIVLFQTIDTKNAVECPMFTKFTLYPSKTDSILEGELYSDEDHKYVAPPIHFVLHKNMSDTVVVAPPPPTLPKPIEIAPPVVVKPIIKDTVVKTITPPVVKPYTDTLLAIRKKVPVDILEVSDSIIKVELYDNGDIDFDSVTMYYNGNLILPKRVLSHAAIKLDVEVTETNGFDELGMLANNVGLIPPNTAVMVVFDGNKRYEYIMASDFNKTATLRLRRKSTGKP